MPKGKGGEKDAEVITVSTSTVEGQYREREKLTIFHSVNDYTAKMAYIAHWLTPDGEDGFVAAAIGAEAEAAGLESNASKHPDQAFWSQKGLVKKPSSSSVIVTDCKLLPCSTHFTSCQYKVPTLIAGLYGKGIPIAVFAHNEYIAKKTDKKWCYYTYSGATPQEVDEHIRTTLAPWNWE
jgi:hypothetical protein